MVLGGEGGLAAARQLGVGVLLHVEHLLHHVRGEVNGRALQQFELLLVHREAHPILAVLPHVVIGAQLAVESELVGIALASFFVMASLHPEEISSLRNSFSSLAYSFLEMAYVRKELYCYKRAGE